jgi:peptidoglycan hydrolase CwlO-like protein
MSDKRIAELEAKNTALEKEIQELKKRNEGQQEVIKELCTFAGEFERLLSELNGRANDTAKRVKAREDSLDAAFRSIESQHAKLMGFFRLPPDDETIVGFSKPLKSYRLQSYR